MQLKNEIMLESFQAVPQRNGPIVNDMGESDTLYDDNMDLGFSPKTYTLLENHKTWSSKIVTARGSVDLRSWTLTHPEQWTTKEVLDWIFSVVQLIEDFQFENFRGEKFNKLSGKELCNMSRESFCALDPMYGDKLYSILNTMLKTASFKEPGGLEEFQPPQDFTVTHQVTQPTMVDEIYRSLVMNCNSTDLAPLSTYTIADFAYDFSVYECPPIPEPPFIQDTSSNDDDAGYSSSSSDGQTHNAMGGCMNPDIMFSSIDPTNQLCPPDAMMHCQQEMQHLQMNPSPMHSSHQTGNPPSKYIKRGPGRPPRRPRGSATSEYGGSDDDGTGGRPRNRSPGTHKGNHLWEFIRDLLKDHQHRNRLIRWENKEDGVFKIVNSEQVAKLWGAKKNNHTMTYEKFSRAMRFCRSAGYFSDIPKTGNYPKKLCFKFGPKSFGWED